LTHTLWLVFRFILPSTSQHSPKPLAGYKGVLVVNEKGAEKTSWKKERWGKEMEEKESGKGEKTSQKIKFLVMSLIIIRGVGR